MLKKRIIAALPVHNGIVVQSKNFKHYLPVGKPAIAIEFLNRWGIDEIALIDITARRKGTAPDFNLIKQSGAKCQVPLAVGGGITSLDHVHQLMQCGADKVILNRPLFEDATLITKIAHAYGDQCVIVSIDAIHHENAYQVYNYLEHKAERFSIEDAAKKAEDAGAGEILINSVARDGSYSGYDNDLINRICSVVSIPVIALGGARNATDMITLFNQSAVAAAAAGNFFHFTEHSVNLAKREVFNAGISIRVETYADYKENTVDKDSRLQKKPDAILENLLYIRVEKEII